MTEDDKKRQQLETLQKLRDMAGNYRSAADLFIVALASANDTLDLSLLSVDDLRKAIDVPKELRSNQIATIMYQMDEIRKLVRRTNSAHPRTIDLCRKIA